MVDDNRHNLLMLGKKVTFNHFVQIHSWLERIFDGQPVPQYEVNATTINLLEQLYKLNHVSDNDAKCLVDDAKQKALEYSYEGRVQRFPAALIKCLGSCTAKEIHIYKLYSK